MAMATAKIAGIHFINRSLQATFKHIPPFGALELPWIPLKKQFQLIKQV
jgi:hypothetical protein